ncbi:D-amino-acid transaminase [Rummeliibacillus sp. TYF005]|uniref:D-amino-acid transaminase n=1 Tax=unclassified Rummeliibacillus TaxID=2622809 RepID=UPI000E66E10E|nr:MULTISPECIES: D-amino-acid transaminase [unclassified Rummeliibacillus]RIJ66676.1 D-amino-acid transaminase [Rummeliibacillus sp. POC4]RPJ95866.1 D-amino-acid transaminase [Rummeliibacillus sp. TYF005]
MEKMLLNNDLIDNDQMKLSINDRGYQFGDGIYEVIKVYNGNLFTPTEHIDRLYRSAEEIRLVIPYTKDVLHKMLYDLVEENELTDGHIYLQITRGVSPRNHAFPIEPTEPVLIAYTQTAERPVNNHRNGVSAILVEDIRWLRCDIKSLNLLGNVLAKQKAHEANCYEAIQHRGEIVTEGSSSNIYGIKNGVLYTHPTNQYILNGITRQVVMKCCQELGIQVVEEPMTKEELLQMDEVFLSSTTSEITPIIKIDDSIINSGKPGDFTRKIQQAFEEKVQQVM